MRHVPRLRSPIIHLSNPTLTVPSNQIPQPDLDLGPASKTFAPSAR